MVLSGHDTAPQTHTHTPICCIQFVTTLTTQCYCLPTDSAPLLPPPPPPFALADVTQRMDVERKLAELTTAQMSMLEQMFPRHVIEAMLSDPALLSQDGGRGRGGLGVGLAGAQ